MATNNCNDVASVSERSLCCGGQTQTTTAHQRQGSALEGFPLRQGHREKD
eukprot:COSAG02_NODE_1026_length_15134_cov_382.979714_16_plen_50_part_00